MLALDFWGLAGFFGLACAVVMICGVRLAESADRIADLTGLGEAVVGAAFLGMVTSLSGGVTSTTAALAGHTDLAISNALGGIATQTVFLVAADLAYRHANLEHAAASLPNLVYGVLLNTMLVILLLAEVLPPVTVWGVHPVSLALICVYGAGLRFADRATRYPLWRPRETDATVLDHLSAAAPGGHSLVRELTMLTGLGVMVGGAGYVIADTGVALAALTGLEEGALGVFLTAFVTSVPELVTTLAAIRQGALTLAVSGILGGNVFDVLILSAADVGYRDGSIYHAFRAEHLFLILLSVLMTCVLVLGLLRREYSGPANVGGETVALFVLYIAGMSGYVLIF